MSVLIPVLAIDGPSGAGKGTVSRAIAKALGWHYLDSGAIYRSLAVFINNNNLPLDEEEIVAEKAENLKISFRVDDELSVFLEGADITAQLSTETCGNTASRVAVFPKVRQALLQKQREFRQPPGLVADGRDMGTVVFPDATHKIYLTASAGARAQRRYDQLNDKGIGVTLHQIIKELEKRDRRDKGRENAPLKKAEDAVIIDSTEMTVEQVIEQSLGLIKLF